LITGGAGYIGSHAVLAASQWGFIPVTFDNLSEGHRWAVKDGRLIVGDLADGKRIKRVMKEVRPAAVMHFASHCYVGESVINPRKYYHDNVTNALNLFDAMLASRVRHFIFSSSCATYGNPLKVPMPEDHPQDPVNPYGDTKMMIEHILSSYDGAYGLKSVCLRYFNAAGADASASIGEVHDPETHLIPLVLDAAMGRRPSVTVFGDDYPTKDGTCIRDYIHVTDLADAHFKALKRMMRTGKSDAFNLGTGRGYTVLEVIRAAGKATGRKVPTRIGPRRAGDPPALVADSRKARRVLKWTPRHSGLENIMDTAWKWHRRYFRGR
jgi:UDP-glucose-4-epimerase GalE